MPFKNSINQNKIGLGVILFFIIFYLLFFLIPFDYYFYDTEKPHNYSIKKDLLTRQPLFKKDDISYVVSFDSSTIPLKLFSKFKLASKSK